MNRAKNMTLNMVNYISDNVTVLRCSGRLVLGEGEDALREKVKKLLLQGHRIVVNLTELEHIDSMGLATIAGLHRLDNSRIKHTPINRTPTLPKIRDSSLPRSTLVARPRRSDAVSYLSLALSLMSSKLSSRRSRPALRRKVTWPTILLVGVHTSFRMVCRVFHACDGLSLDRLIRGRKFFDTLGTSIRNRRKSFNIACLSGTVPIHAL